MNTYTANFTNGQAVTRKTDKAYTHAFCVTLPAPQGGTYTQTGFASSAELAEKAVAAKVSAFCARWERTFKAGVYKVSCPAVTSEVVAVTTA
jgi:hypothetical protein